MGFQSIIVRQSGHPYERLIDINERTIKLKPRGRWVRNINGRLKALRLTRSRKITLRVIVFSSRIARIYSKLVRTMLNGDGICPAIIFSSQWGLPVLSHSSVNRRKSATISIDRKWAC